MIGPKLEIRGEARLCTPYRIIYVPCTVLNMYCIPDKQCSVHCTKCVIYSTHDSPKQYALYNVHDVYSKVTYYIPHTCIVHRIYYELVRAVN